MFFPFLSVKILILNSIPFFSPNLKPLSSSSQMCLSTNVIKDHLIKQPVQLILQHVETVCNQDLDNTKSREKNLAFIPDMNLYHWNQETRPFIRDENVHWSHSRLSSLPHPQTGGTKELVDNLGVMVRVTYPFLQLANQNPVQNPTKCYLLLHQS